MANAWGLSFGTAWNISWGGVTSPSSSPVHLPDVCVELREDGSIELREDYGYELLEFCEPGGGGYTYTECRSVFNYAKQWQQPSAELHNAAVRLGTKGGIASGKARNR